MYISRSAVKKILRGAGAERVGDDAMLALQTYLNRMAFSTALRAVKLAKHAKRKTVSVSDIKLAAQE